MQRTERTFALAVLSGDDFYRTMQSVFRPLVELLLAIALGLVGGAGCGYLGLLLMTVPLKYVSHDLGFSGAYVPLEVFVGITGLYFAVGTLGSLRLAWRWLKNTSGDSATSIRALLILVTTALGVLSIFWLTALLHWTPLPPLFAIALFLYSWFWVSRGLCQRDIIRDLNITTADTEKLRETPAFAHFYTQQFAAKSKVTGDALFIALSQAGSAFLPILAAGLVESFLGFYYSELSAFCWLTSALTTFLSRKAIVSEWRRVLYDNFTEAFERVLLVTLLPWLTMCLTIVVCAYYGRPDYVAWCLALLTGYLTHRGIYHALVFQNQLLGGRPIVSFRDASRAASKTRKLGDKGRFFGGTHIGKQYDVAHRVYVGMTRAGKTISMLLLWMDSFREIGAPGVDHRAFIYDAKRDGYKLLAYVKLHKGCQVLNVTPSDARSFKWKMRGDVTDRASAWDATCLLFFDRKNSNEFFTKKARGILYGVVIYYLIRAEERRAALIRESAKKGLPAPDEETLAWETRWSFEDVIRVMSDPELIEKALNSYPETQRQLKTLKDDETRQNVYATIGSYLTEYEIIAGFWNQVPDERSISMREWVSKKPGSIILAQKDPLAEEMSEAVYGLLFAFLVKATMDLPDSTARRIMCSLDEAGEGSAREGQRWPKLSTACLQSASKGGCIWLSMQDVGTFRDKYGERIADGILAQMTFQNLFRVKGKATEEYCSEVCGKRYIMNHPISHGPNGVTISEQKEEPWNVTPSSWAGLPMAEPLFEAGIYGWYESAVTGVFFNHLSGEFLKKRFPKIDTTKIVDVERRPGSHQALLPWTPDEAVRLGFMDDPIEEILKAEREGFRHEAKDQEPISEGNSFSPPPDLFGASSLTPEQRELIRKLNENSGMGPVV